MLSYLIIAFIIVEILIWYEYKYTNYLQEKLKRSFIRISWSVMIASFISGCIIFPILEESVFRCASPALFGHYEWHAIINPIIFALIHFSNYKLNCSIKLTCYQVFITFLLGCYLMELGSLGEMIITHGIYNFIVITVELLMQRYYCPKLFDTSVKSYRSTNFYVEHKKTGKFIKSKSCSDLVSINPQPKIEYHMSQSYSVDIDTLPNTEINKSIKIFQNNRKY
jgi:hypothetical protein